MSNQKKVGVIGLGAIGLGLAKSLRRAGHHVRVCDIRPEIAQAFAAEGGTAVESPAELAKACDVVVSALFNADQNEAVLIGPDGALAAMSPGRLLVMCSTVDPAWSEAMEQRLEDQGLHYLEAPVSGGEEAASAGTLTIIAAGSAVAFAQADDLLKVMASNVYRVGQRAGAASTVKLINQLLVCVHQAAAAEAMALAIRRGVDPQTMYDVVTHSFANSVCFEKRIQPVITGDYSSKSVLDILVKDLAMILQVGRDCTFPLPLAATAQQMFLQASAAGHGREAVAAVIKIFPGIQLPEKA